MARAGADDVAAQGPMEIVLPAVQRFATEVWLRCGVRVNWSKSAAYLREGELPPYAPPGLSLAGVQVGDTFLRGTTFYGAFIGSADYQTYMLRKVKDKIVEDAERSREVFSTDRQGLWTALRLSIQARFQYLMQLTSPSICEPVAGELDDDLWRIFEAACGFSVPRGREEGGLPLSVPVPSWDQKSYQECLVRLPVRLYGWGLRSLQSTCGPAYLGCLETALPFMSGLAEICPQLAESWGGRECWGPDSNPATRWRTVLASGCSEGEEVRRTWRRIQEQATAAAAWVGEEEVPEILAAHVEGIGTPCEEASVYGATRGRVVTALENLQSKVMSKALQAARVRKTRPAMAWRQFDRVSSAWRLALPGGDTNLTSAEFAEAAASNLCLPSPACIGKVGETVKGRVKVDIFGDNVQSTTLNGGHYTLRHDHLLNTLGKACDWAGVQCNLEVFNLFSGHLRQEGLSRLQLYTQRQGLVPDMRIMVPPMPEPLLPGGTGVRSSTGAEGQVQAGGVVEGEGLQRGRRRGANESLVLHELKVISCNQTRYKPTVPDRAVDRRAALLPGEYLDKARGADQKYNGVLPGQVGAIERKLVELGKVRGIVSGAFGEVSEATQALIAHLATSRVRKVGVRKGGRGLLRSEDAERAIAMSSLRRRVGVATVRCQAITLLGRLETLGPGTTAAVGRRQQAKEMEKRWRREEAAHALARRQGWSVYRTGFARLD